MSLYQTLFAAFLLMIFVVLSLGIGYLITGKNKLRKGCGMRPKDKDGSCPMCGKENKCDEEKKQ